MSAVSISLLPSVGKMDEPSSLLNAGHQLRMLCNLLSRKTCDSILRDIVSYYCHESGAKWKDWAMNNVQSLKQYMWYHKVVERFSPEEQNDGIPLLKNCDTTFLVYILRHFPSVVDVVKNGVDQLRNIRNNVCHSSLDEMTSEEYNSKIDELSDTGKKLLQALLKDGKLGSSSSIQKHLDFLQEHRSDTFEDFRLKFPDIVKFDERLSALDIKIEQESKQRKEEQVRLEGKINAIQADLDTKNIAKRVLENLPIDNIPDLAPIFGRDEDLKELKNKVDQHTLNLITGPPGIGKTTLALNFVKNFSSQVNTCCLKVDFSTVSLNNEEDRKELKQILGRRISRLFPAIASHVVDDDDDALDILASHIDAIRKYSQLKLMVVLDNVDSVIINSDFWKLLGDLTSSDKRVKFICTCRVRQTTSTGNVFFSHHDVKPISEEFSKSLLMSLLTNNSGTIDVISKACQISGGVPLAMKLIAAAIRQSKIRDLNDLDEFKDGPDLKPLRASLKWSLDNLKPYLFKTMLCASVFVGSIPKKSQTLFDVYRLSYGTATDGDTQKTVDFRPNFLLECHGQGLLEFDRKLEKYYFHPYIREFICESYCKEFDLVSTNFYLLYYQKLISLARKQLSKNGFVPSVNEYNNDIQYYERFIKKFHVSDDHIGRFKEIIEDDELSYYWLSASLWFLEKQPNTYLFLKHFVEQLEDTFSRLDMHSHVVICKAFLGHYIFRVDPMMSRKKLNEAYDIVLANADGTPGFCLGHLQLQMGLFCKRYQHPKTEIETISTSGTWELRDVVDFLNEAIKSIKSWELDGMKDLKSNELIKSISMVEKTEISIRKYRHSSTEDVPIEERKDLTNGLIPLVNTLHEILGDHADCAYASGEVAHMLSFNDQYEEACTWFEKSLNMYEKLTQESSTSFIKDEVRVRHRWGRSTTKYSDEQKGGDMIIRNKTILEENDMAHLHWAEFYCTTGAKILISRRTAAVILENENLRKEREAARKQAKKERKREKKNKNQEGADVTHQSLSPKNRLQEHCQKLKKPLPFYETNLQEGAGLYQTAVTVLGEKYVGELSKTKKAAEVSAAEIALATLDRQEDAV